MEKLLDGDFVWIHAMWWKRKIFRKSKHDPAKHNCDWLYEKLRMRLYNFIRISHQFNKTWNGCELPWECVSLSSTIYTSSISDWVALYPGDLLTKCSLPAIRIQSQDLNLLVGNGECLFYNSIKKFLFRKQGLTSFPWNMTWSRLCVCC